MNIAPRDLADFNKILSYLTNQALALVGSAFVLVVIVIGIRIYLSSMNEHQYEQAKRSLQRAAIGAAVCWLAYWIAGVIKKATGLL